MSTPTFNTRHAVTGVLQRLTEDQIRPFKNVLEIVPDDAKPYEPGLFKPGNVGEFDNVEPADSPKPAPASKTSAAKGDLDADEGDSK